MSVYFSNKSFFPLAPVSLHLDLIHSKLQGPIDIMARYFFRGVNCYTKCYGTRASTFVLLPKIRNSSKRGSAFIKVAYNKTESSIKVSVLNLQQRISLPAAEQTGYGQT